MKKIILFFAFMVAVITSQGQITKYLANFTDTITDVATAYYTMPGTQNGTATVSITQPWHYAIDTRVEHISGTGDSTVVSFEGSIDNSTWYKLTNLGNPMTAALATSTVTYSPSVCTTAIAGTSTGTTYAGGSFMVIPGEVLKIPYLRMKVQHYETGTARVKSTVYIKK